MAEIQLNTNSFHTTLRCNPICPTNYKSSWICHGDVTLGQNSSQRNEKYHEAAGKAVYSLMQFLTM